MFDPLLGRVLGDRYRILERVGAGAMGQVYRAAHNRIACIFAVKVLYGDLAYDDEMLSRFLREAELASCLQSRHIVRVTDFGNEGGGLPYMVMEYLDGPSLQDVITRQGPLQPDRAATIAQRIARGLGLAHERGVIHRDLKPENVALVTEDDEPDVVKLLDFGVARMRDGDRLTAYGVVIGTPLYMSPEQVTGQELDARSDLYSLGVCLYEMLSGKVPFDGPNVHEIARKHVTEQPPSLRPVLDAAKAPRALDDVVQRLLAKSPADRYATSRDVIDAIAKALATGVALVSVPPPPSSLDRGPVSKRTRSAIQQAIMHGAPLYNSGDHAGCYALYEQTAEQVIQDVTEPWAIKARLQSALRRAATRASATEAAWDMRYGFDDLLMCECEIDKADRLRGELSIYRAIASRREGDGAFDLVGDYALALARELAAHLRVTPGRAEVAATLDAAAEQAEAAGGASAALPILGSLLAQLASGEALSTPDTASLRPSLPAVSVPRASAVGDDARERIMRAIRIGAPAYNEGRPEVCARVYRDAAKELLEITRNDARAEAVTRYLEKALRDAAGRAPTEAAWTLRHAFDAILASG